MIVEVIHPVHTGGRWFKQGQQFLLKGTRMKHLPGGWALHMVVDTSDGEWELPQECVSVLQGDNPAGETPGPLEKAYDFMVRDPCAALLGKKDAVLAAREFLGVDIAARALQDQADYNRAFERIRDKVPVAQAGELPPEPPPASGQGREAPSGTDEFDNTDFNQDYT